jgi:hypothetical protein
MHVDDGNHTNPGNPHLTLIRGNQTKKRFSHVCSEGTCQTLLRVVQVQVCTGSNGCCGKQGVEIQLGLAIENVKASVAVKRRLACEQVKYWLQVLSFLYA